MAQPNPPWPFNDLARRLSCDVIVAAPPWGQFVLGAFRQVAGPFLGKELDSNSLRHGL
jgi:hypothetical protein